MRTNPKSALAALALLAIGSSLWACDLVDTLDDNPSHMVRRVLRPMPPGGRSSSMLFEPWYEACADIADLPPRGALDGSGAAGDSDTSEQAPKPAGAVGSFAIPPTAAYGWVALRYTKGDGCGSAKVYLDKHLVETLALHNATGSQRCERTYYLEDHSAQEHHFEVTTESKSGGSSSGYACLDSVVVGW